MDYSPKLKSAQRIIGEGLKGRWMEYLRPTVYRPGISHSPISKPFNNGRRLANSGKKPRKYQEPFRIHAW